MKPRFAKRMGVSVPTVTRWEAGEVGSIGAAVVIRQQLAQRIQAATDCPPELLGLAEDGAYAGPVSLERDVADLRETLVEVVNLLAEMTQSEPDEALDRLTERLDPTSPRSPGKPLEGQGR